MCVCVCYFVRCTNRPLPHSTADITFSYENRNVIRNVLSDHSWPPTHVARVVSRSHDRTENPLLSILSLSLSLSFSRSTSFEKLVYREGNCLLRRRSLTSKRAYCGLKPARCCSTVCCLCRDLMRPRSRGNERIFETEEVLDGILRIFDLWKIDYGEGVRGWTEIPARNQWNWLLFIVVVSRLKQLKFEEEKSKHQIYHQKCRCNKCNKCYIARILDSSVLTIQRGWFIIFKGLRRESNC